MKRIFAAITMIIAAVAVTLTVGSPAQASGTCYRTLNVFASWGDSGPVPVPSSGTTLASVTCFMGQGAQSAAVTRLQSTLNKCYGKNLVEDGIFGSLTKTALKQAQTAEGITSDGVYGPNTRDALGWWTGGYWGDGSPVCAIVDQPVTLA
jgi:Putative peptidoglycan binding domain